MNKIVFYGTRGSGSLTSSKYMEFGGATTCIMLNLGKSHIMVDAGSGVSNAIDDLAEIKELHLFITHSHIDHICGIATLLQAFSDRKLHIWGKSYNNVEVQDTIERIMSNELWPVRASTYQNVEFHNISGDIQIDDVHVTTMDSNHPGGCTLYRFDHGNDSIVTAFDFCHLGGYEEKLCDFAKGATALIYDGNMTEWQLLDKPNWGHSTPEAGARIGAKLGVRDVFITHFGLFDDDSLSNWENKIKKAFPFVSFARSGVPQNEYRKIVDIGTLLNVEKDNTILMTKILETCMGITNADGGTLYLLEDRLLEFKIMINKSKGAMFVSKNQPINMPSVEITAKNVCATAARDNKVINVEDCYSETDYDFSGVIKYDELNDYHTKSVLVVPLNDENNDVIGVLQLINAHNENGVVIPFRKQEEEIVKALANQASLAIVNSSYAEKINELLYGFVKVMSVGIDERTPYNANHTKNMVAFADRFFDFEDLNRGPFYVDSKKRREILMSIWLHDTGKILTPLYIMNKDSRLGQLTQTVENRFERRELLLKLSLSGGKISKEEYETLETERKEQLEFIRLINKVGFLSDELKEQLKDLATKTYLEIDDTVTPVITNEEHYQLSILKGTLSKEERNIMEGHVSMTQKLLAQLNFPKNYDNIPTYAGNHHEFLDGSGYPNHLTEKDLPWPCRLITICDIYEALTAKDRPYKKPMPSDKAFSILYEMADFGKLDRDIIEEFERSKAWER